MKRVTTAFVIALLLLSSNATLQVENTRSIPLPKPKTTPNGVDKEEKFPRKVMQICYIIPGKGPPVMM